jgi:hypothetical protein
MVERNVGERRGRQNGEETEKMRHGEMSVMVCRECGVQVAQRRMFVTVKVDTE